MHTWIKILLKNIKNITSIEDFTRWQAIVSVFIFDIEFIKEEINSLFDFLTQLIRDRV